MVCSAMAATSAHTHSAADLVTREVEDVEEAEGDVPTATGEAEEAGVLDLAGPERLVDEEPVAVPSRATGSTPSPSQAAKSSA